MVLQTILKEQEQQVTGLRPAVGPVEKNLRRPCLPQHSTLPSRLRKKPAIQATFLFRSPVSISLSRSSSLQTMS